MGITPSTWCTWNGTSVMACSGKGPFGIVVPGNETTNVH